MIHEAIAVVALEHTRLFVVTGKKFDQFRLEGESRLRPDARFRQGDCEQSREGTDYA